MADGGKFVKIDFAPGIDRDATQRTALPSWYDIDKVRFRNGLPENFYGWQRANASPEIMDGVARGIHAWANLQGTSYVAAGTHKKLYVSRGDVAYDITPIMGEVTVSSGMSAIQGSAIISVSVTNSASQGDFVVLQTLDTTLGGNVNFNQNTGPFSSFEIQSATSVGFTFNYVTVAESTSTASAGNNRISFLIEPGTLNGEAGTGWGTSTWGTGTWGTVRNVGENQTFGTYWSLANWGEDLLALKNQSQIYTWHLSAGISSRATLITASPSVNDYMLVSNERFVISFGTTSQTSGDYAPMRVRWSASENFSDWVASVGNDAGDYILTGGSRIMTAVKTRGEILVLTDKTAWVMRYISEPFIYGFEQAGDNCGSASFHGAVDVNGVVYWMSDHGFHRYRGVVEDIPCPIHRYIFDQREDGAINKKMQWKTYAGTNVKYNEVIFFYQGKNGVDCDHYVIYNIEENIWYYGTLNRSSWIDRGNFSNPIATAIVTTGTSLDTCCFYYHDIDEGEGIEAFTSYIESGSFDVEEGDKLLFVNRLIPDLDIDSGDIKFYLKSRKYPGRDWTVKGPYTVSTSSELINVRSRGRSFAIRIESSTSSAWTLGSLRMAIQPDGEQ